ncbi:hypothetical protein N3K66_004789 [Trichothecium roseum]|uniref:Uncharacterized protein n=1 Tax=Trichothecium roseum TaxID=47278 RepID=A0ACC0V2M0_9HYPO|nr:hypothetical protein N3K66_004789 [Trichothecium roseum]
MTAAAVVAKEQKQQQHISPSGANNNGDGDNDDGYVRLHVTPLDAELLGIVVSQSVLPRARNVSYHALETFPERRYGFVELPREDADRLRAKLHGATLRGHKMRVEKARPEARVVGPKKEEEEDEEDNTTRAEKKEKKKKSKKSRRNDDDDDNDKDGEELGVDADLGSTSRKRKRDHNVVDGLALTDRKVKRGWSETADAAAPKKQRRDKKSDPSKDKEARKKDRQEKKRVRSKYTEGEECLLKMKVPPGSAAAARNLLPEEDAASRKKRKSKGKDREVTIHEFERTSKFPGFLKSAAAGSADGAKRAAAEFVEGRGWVDDEGNVVEAVSLNKPPPRPAKKPKKRAPTPEPVVEEEEEDDDETSSSGTSSSGESDDEDEEIPVPAPVPEKKRQPEPQQPVADDSSDTSSSDSSDTSSSEDEEEEEEEEEEETRSSTAKTPQKVPEAARPVSSSSSRSLTIKIPPATPSGKTVHPLEALYKRDKNGDGVQEAPEPFSFFGGDADEEEDDEEQEEEGPPVRLRTPMPMTPFTKQEFERRIVRSAAPTPDTAHPSRMANFWPAYEAEADEEADNDDADDMAADEDDGQDAEAPADKSANDFQSWFWENRRDLNRSWMSRRKSAAKEKRHRENKARASRAV